MVRQVAAVQRNQESAVRKHDRCFGTSSRGWACLPSRGWLVCEPWRAAAADGERARNAIYFCSKRDKASQWHGFDAAELLHLACGQPASLRSWRVIAAGGSQDLGPDTSCAKAAASIRPVTGRRHRRIWAGPWSAASCRGFEFAASNWLRRVGPGTDPSYAGNGRRFSRAS